MWWLIPIAAVGVAKLTYELFADEQKIQPIKKKSIFESNLGRLNEQLHNTIGRKVAILGQPGAGKSSLLKSMTGGRVCPLPVIGVETDATNWSTDNFCTLLSRFQGDIFVDVPGYDTESHPTDIFLSYFPWSQFDAFILVIGGKLHRADENIYQHLAREGKMLCVARSFSESLDSSERESVKTDLASRLCLIGNLDIKFFSSRTTEGLSEIYDAVIRV